MARDLKKRIIILVILGACVIFLCVYVLAVVLSSFFGIEPAEEETMKPLEFDVVQDLCQQFDLSEDDPLCQPQSGASSYDFYLIIGERFVPGEATYEEVQEAIGEYQYRRDPLVTLADGTSYYDCWYDLHGGYGSDSPLRLSFTDDDVLLRLRW